MIRQCVMRLFSRRTNAKGQQLQPFIKATRDTEKENRPYLHHGTQEVEGITMYLHKRRIRGFDKKDSNLDLNGEECKKARGFLDRWLRNKQFRQQLFVLILMIVVATSLIIRAKSSQKVGFQKRMIKFVDPDGNENSLRKPKINVKPEVCFVTASYAKDSSNMDNLVHVINTSPYMRFYLFTNLNDEQWETPGWEKIVTNFTYRRTITHSRYGKFLGWKYSQIQECKAVFYSDSYNRPTQNQTVWREIAHTLSSTSPGLMQIVNPKNRSGIFGEFFAIQRSNKDIESNIIKSLKWMLSQSDFDPDIPIYLNEQFGYSPKSKIFQKVSQAFWDRYSQEVDSWRDQPLWAFMMHRYNVTPIPWPSNKLWGRSSKDYGHNAHKYQTEEDVAANF